MSKNWLDKAKETASTIAKGAQDVAEKAQLDKVGKLLHSGQQRIEILEERLKMHEKLFEEMGKELPPWPELKAAKEDKKEDSSNEEASNDHIEESSEEPSAEDSGSEENKE